MKKLFTIFLLALLLIVKPQHACAQTQKHVTKATTTNATTQSSKMNKTTISNPGANKDIILTGGKLGPIGIGTIVSTFPKQVAGLYDKCQYKKEEHEDEMDGSWTEEYYLFTKAAKPVFRANISEGKVSSIRLLEGSTYIKTPDGIHVGYSASELFKKKKMEWETYYEGDVFASDGKFTYYVSSDNLVSGLDIPTKATDFKANAKVCAISY